MEYETIEESLKTLLLTDPKLIHFLKNQLQNKYNLKK